MRVLDSTHIAQELARLLGKPIVLLNGIDLGDDNPYPDRRLPAAPFLSLDDHLQVIGDGFALVVCDDEAEWNRVYHLTHGDDGMTSEGELLRQQLGYPSYNGKVRIYALTIAADGTLMNENT